MPSPDEIGHELELRLMTQPQLIARLAALRAERDQLNADHERILNRLQTSSGELRELRDHCQHTQADGSPALVYPDSAGVIPSTPGLCKVCDGWVYDGEVSPI